MDPAIMNKSQSSYKQIMKGTSLFGGVQVFNIIVKIVQTKIIAILIGPSGIGILGLLNSSLGVLGASTNFGLRTSAVKNVAEAVEEGNNQKIYYIISILRRLVWFTGSLGAIVTILFSSILSELVFGSEEYAYAFIWVSITLLFNQITAGNLVVLQGLRRLNLLAQVNMIGAFLGLVITIPMYYYWRIDAIVPAIISVSIISMFVSLYFSNKVEVESLQITKTQLINDGKDMMTMGFMLSLSALITLGNSLLIRIFISDSGGLNEVGLYTAGITIITVYAGLVFNAMGTDYYPRLSSIANNNDKARLLMNQQAEMSVLILSPILSVFLIFLNIGIVILYSPDFIKINGMLEWSALGMYFKAASWSIAYLLLAKGDSTLFFKTELIANIYGLILNLLGYHYFGLEGLGVTLLLGYAIYFIHVFMVAKYKYTFYFDSYFFRIFVIHFALGISCFLIARILDNPFRFLLGIIVIVISFWYSYQELNKRISLKEIWNSKFGNSKR